MTQTRFGKYSLSNRTLNVLNRAGFETIEEIASFVREGNNLIDLAGCGRKSVMEIERMLAECKADVTPMEIIRETPIADSYSGLIPMAKCYLERRYVRLRGELLSVRSNNMLYSRAVSFADFVGFMDYSSRELAEVLRINPRTKFADEIENLRQAMLHEINNIAGLSRDELQGFVLSERFSFLSEDELAFAVAFKEREGYLPSFFIVQRYMEHADVAESRANDAKAVQIYRDCLASGDIQAVADMYDLSRERVRQVFVSHVQPQKFAMQLDWDTYDLDASDVMTEQSEVYKTVCSKECPGMSFLEFSGIVQLVSCLDAEPIADKWFLIDPNVVVAEQVRKAVASLRYNASKQFSHDTIVNMESFADGMQMSSRVFKAMAAVFACFAKVCGDRVIFPQNHINIGEEISEILHRNKAPMHIDDIYYLLLHKYPDMKYSNVDELRSYVHALTEVKMSASGNGLVCLCDSNETYYAGSIRQKVVDVLNEYGRPMSSEELTAQVQRVFPDTNWHSICSSFFADPYRSLVRTADGLYALVA